MILITDISPEVGVNEQNNLIMLAERTTFEARQLEYLGVAIRQITSLEEYDEMYRHIMLNIIEDKDRIAMGFNYNATDIKKTLKQL